MAATFGDNANPVTVNANSEVTLSGGIALNYNAKLFGFGIGNNNGDTSPLMSVQGNNTWLGNITFDTSAHRRQRVLHRRSG